LIEPRGRSEGRRCRQVRRRRPWVKELRALVASLSRTTPVVEDAAKRLATCAGHLERTVVAQSEKLAEFQRSQNGAFWDLREIAQGPERQADVLVT